MLIQAHRSVALIQSASWPRSASNIEAACKSIVTCAGVVTIGCVMYDRPHVVHAQQLLKRPKRRSWRRPAYEDFIRDHVGIA
jgi:hypothetical protein